jgi:hypothetical protein
MRSRRNNRAAFTLKPENAAGETLLPNKYSLNSNQHSELFNPTKN